MRRFHSYGPVNCKIHFCAPRTELVERCLQNLIGDEVEEGGHYFTIWAPRQTGKTWLMRQMESEIPKKYGEQFVFYRFSLGNLRGMRFSSEQAKQSQVHLPEGLRMVLIGELPGRPDVATWDDFKALFSKKGGLWERPLILMIDEVDTAPPALLDLIAGQFRELYLKRETHWLHGLALVGVRAVLGIESERGSPFNVQRSLHVPNLTHDEVQDMYRQYQEESGQDIVPAVVEAVYASTRGQPGLVSWFGELLTETYNPGAEQCIDLNTWKLVWLKARFKEPNNTVMNLIAKARMPEYQHFLVQLFSRQDIPFSFHDPLHNYLYLHGIIESEVVQQEDGELVEICRFTSPFVQECLYRALSRELVDEQSSVLVLDPLDELTDVFEGEVLELPVLLQRYKDYLARLNAKGLNPWKDQPRRKTDSHLTEAVGHFHLYTWLHNAVGRRCSVSPEFPTGNGKVDIHLKCGDRRGIIEVKSFVNAYQAKKDREQAAQYAKSLGLESVTLATFLPIEDEDVLRQLSVTETIDGVQVSVVAIGWA